MSAKIKLSTVFQSMADNQEYVEVKGNTIRESLNEFVTKYPDAASWIIDKKGTLLSFVLLNGEIVNSNDLDKPITEADELYVLPMIDGG